jgi:hypothetical protein
MLGTAHERNEFRPTSRVERNSFRSNTRQSNTTGGVGGKFEEMYHFCQYKREQFLPRYHKRSNVASC